MHVEYNNGVILMRRGFNGSGSIPAETLSVLNARSTSAYRMALNKIADPKVIANACETVGNAWLAAVLQCIKPEQPDFAKLLNDKVIFFLHIAFANSKERIMVAHQQLQKLPAEEYNHCLTLAYKLLAMYSVTSKTADLNRIRNSIGSINIALCDILGVHAVKDLMMAIVNDPQREWSNEAAESIFNQFIACHTQTIKQQEEKQAEEIKQQEVQRAKASIRHGFVEIENLKRDEKLLNAKFTSSKDIKDFYAYTNKVRELWDTVVKVGDMIRSVDPEATDVAMYKQEEKFAGDKLEELSALEMRLHSAGYKIPGVYSIDPVPPPKHPTLRKRF